MGQPLVARHGANGEPLYANIDGVWGPTELWDDTKQLRNTSGIHLVEESNLSELQSYIARHDESVLVKCNIYGRYVYEAGVGYRCTAALPILVAGVDKDLLLRVANRYHIDIQNLEEEGFKVYEDENITGTINSIDGHNPSYKIYEAGTGDLLTEIHTEGSGSRMFVSMEPIPDARIVKPFLEKMQLQYWNPEMEDKLPQKRWVEWDTENRRDRYAIGQNYYKLLPELAYSYGKNLEYIENWQPETRSEEKWTKDPDEFGLHRYTTVEILTNPPLINFPWNDWETALKHAIKNDLLGSGQPGQSSVAELMITIPLALERLSGEEVPDQIRQNSPGGDIPVAQLISSSLNEIEELIMQKITPEEAETHYSYIFDLLSYMRRILEEAQGDVGQGQLSFGKTADYFYDWQGYQRDDGSLEDGRISPSGPAPAFVNTPSRCSECGGEAPPGHFINLDAYNERSPFLCDACRERNEETPNSGHSWPREHNDYFRREIRSHGTH